MNQNFSVLMSLYSKESPAFLYECLASIYSQTLQPTEIVIVYDGPVLLEHKEVVDGWSNRLPIVVKALESNLGLSKALNFGLSHCSYDLIVRMDTDDICLPERFERQIDFMQKKTHVDICGSFAVDISSTGFELGVRKVPIDHMSIQKYIWSCPMVHPSVVFRKSAIISIGSYGELTPHRQDDYELWIRAMRAGLTFENIPLALLKYRLPDNPYAKNTFSVGIDRLRIGLSAVRQFDPRFSSYIALLFPVIRGLLPVKAQQPLAKIAKKFDPRGK